MRVMYPCDDFIFFFEREESQNPFFGSVFGFLLLIEMIISYFVIGHVLLCTLLEQEKKSKRHRKLALKVSK